LLPGRRFDSLQRRSLASLRSFMLHTPLAQLFVFPEGETRKLTAALNAICHEGRKRPRRPKL
jgi:hypothetical protein